MPNWRFTSAVPETDESVVAVVSDGDQGRRYRITTAPVTSISSPLRGRPGDSPQQRLTTLHITPLDPDTPPLTASAIRVTRLWQLMLSLSAAGCIVSPFVYGFARAFYAWPVALLCTAAIATPIRGRTLPGWIGWLTDQLESRNTAARLRALDEALAALRR